MEEKKVYYLKEAIKEAKKAYKKNEVPVGAVVVCGDKIIARAHNLRESKQLIEGHAEFLAIIKAAKKMGSWRLENCDVYVTMEPCPMCAGAMIQARINNCYYAASDLKSGVASSLMNIFELPFNHQVHSEKVDDNNESEQLLKAFFKELRNK